MHIEEYENDHERGWIIIPHTATEFSAISFLIETFKKVHCDEIPKDLTEDLREILKKLLQSAKDLKYYIDIQPPEDPVKNFEGIPVHGLPAYRVARKTIEEAEDLLKKIKA